MAKQHRDLFKVDPSPPVPDVLFRHTEGAFHLVLECKANSFSPESSTVVQLRKLLHYCGDPDVALGAPAPAVVAYVLPDQCAAQQRTTLLAVTDELRSKGLAPANAATVGLSFSTDGLCADFVSVGVDAGAPWSKLEYQTWQVYPGSGPVRPLYFIPYDPASVREQSASEAAYCERLLAERVLIQAVSELGRVAIPASVHLIASNILREVTFRLSDCWDGNEKNRLYVQIQNILSKALSRGSTLVGKVLRITGGVEVVIASEGDRNAAVELLLKAQVGELARGFSDNQLDAAEPGSGGWLDGEGQK